MTKRVQGIILDKYDFRESDRLFIIYTNELGKIEAVAKGARKIKSKLTGHLGFFSIINLIVAPGRSYYQIAGAEINKNFLNIKSDLVKIVLSNFCLETVNNFTKAAYSDLKIYDVLKDLLEVLDNKKNKDFIKIYGLSKFFVLKLIALLGWTPELYNCVKCKKKIIPNGNFFDAAHGGLVCGKCGGGNLPISMAAIKIFRFALKNNLKKIMALKMSKDQLKEVVKIIGSFVAIHQDKELKSQLWINYLTQPLGV